MLPTARDCWRVLLWVGVLAGVLGFFQLAIHALLQHRFETGEIAFPFALGPVTRAGEATNLIGWGLMLNNAPLPLIHLAMSLCLLLLIAVLTKPVLGWAPAAMAGGGFANLLELGTRGAVLDWIIIPAGSTIRAISLGDVAIFAGALWCIVNVTSFCIRRIREAAAVIRQPGA